MGKPDFIIIGAQKAGTTYLYNCLIQHPCIIPAQQKELHHFDGTFYRSEKFYFSHFSCKKKYEITGEATPYYLFHPYIPERVKKLLPHIKLLVILRNPVDRAYSHYNMVVRKGFESLTFQQAIEQEKCRIYKYPLLLKYWKNVSHRRFSYVARGVYIDQLKRWFCLFDARQIYIIHAEELYQDRDRTLSHIFSFLEIPQYTVPETLEQNKGCYEPIELEMRRILQEYYEDYNQEIYRFLGRDFQWTL